MAREKAQAVPASAEELVLCADTTVALGRRILGKPADIAEAEGFLGLLSGGAGGGGGGGGGGGVGGGGAVAIA